MSGHTPSPDEVFNDYFWGLQNSGIPNEAEARAEFGCMIAEVERAAAVKALLKLADDIERIASSTGIGVFTERVVVKHGGAGMIRDHAAALEPTKRTEGVPEMKKCSFCEMQVESVTVGSDGVTKACADCVGEGGRDEPAS